MEKDVDIHYFQLVLSLQAAAMQQMGKVANPMSGKVERDLTMARNSIDMLEMVERKSRGNLNDDERRLIEHVLYELRLNFVDEQNKAQQPANSPTQAEKPANSDPSSADNS
jgi:hypothetical protein